MFGQAVLNAIIVPARTGPKLYNVDRTMLYPVRLDAARVVPFIIGYLDRMADVGLFKDGRLPLRLGDQILALAESGGQKTPITPLLVTLFVRSAVQRAVDGLSFDGMPQAVPEVFVDYLRRLNSQGDETVTRSMSSRRRRRWRRSPSGKTSCRRISRWTKPSRPCLPPSPTPSRAS